MINHARTLLMNVDGGAGLPAYPGEQIIDPAFRALNLPADLDKVRTALFGTDPDRTMLNYRCWQLLGLTQASPLAGYLTSLDPRITYGFDDTTLVAADTWAPRVVTVRGTGTLSVTGTAEAPDATGRCYHALNLTTTAEGEVTVRRTTKPFSIVELDFTAATRVAVPGTGYAVRFASTAAGQEYVVEAYNRPTRDLGALADACRGLGDTTFNTLFGVPAVEPYLTFRNLWFRKQELPLRLGALVCALVHRSEAVRRGGR